MLSPLRVVVVPVSLPPSTGVVVAPVPEPAVIVPVTEAVKVEGAVVTVIVPIPVLVAAHAGISMQKGPPQVKLCVPQQSRGTIKVSPTESPLMPGLALDKQMASRKVSEAT